MEIIFNNISQQVEENTSIQHVLNTLIGEKQKGIAVAVNQTVISKTEWANYTLKNNDQVLVIKATQGG